MRLGEHDLSATDERHADYSVSGVIRHPRYRPPALYDDIALLKSVYLKSFLIVRTFVVLYI